MKDQSTDLKNTLKKRNEIYGDYETGLLATADIMSIIRQHHKDVKHEKLSMLWDEAIHNIVMKLSRIAVTPTHLDSWHDLSGYALLTEEIIKKGHIKDANKHEFAED